MLASILGALSCRSDFYPSDTDTGSGTGGGSTSGLDGSSDETETGPGGSGEGSDGGGSEDGESSGGGDTSGTAAGTSGTSESGTATPETDGSGSETGGEFEPPPVCYAGTDPYFAESAYVVCEATESWVWLSNTAGDKFHVDAICDELGYEPMNAYGGTGGTVCGYFDGNGCQSPGTPTFGNGGDLGQGPLGRLLTGQFVHWSCPR